MKKILLFCILALCLYSCKIIKHNPSIIKQIDFVLKGQRMIKKMELTYHYGKNSPFIFKDSAIFIPCKINNTINLVFYDNRSSGIGTTKGFLTEKISGNIELPKCHKSIKLRKERKTKNSLDHQIIIRSGLKYYDVESNFFHFNNLVGVVTSLSNDTVGLNYASEKSPHKFIINDILLDWKNVMLLSFSDTTITILDSISMYDTTDFTLVRSSFTCKGIEVYLTIDSMEYSFLFNTGDKGFLTLPQHKKYRECFPAGDQCIYYDVQYEKHKKENDLQLASGRNSNIIDTLIIQQTNIIMGNMDSIAGNISYIKKLSRPVVGMAFISHFNWIIDKYRQKIYAKKIKDIQTVSNSHLVNIFDTALRISLIPVGETKYQLFSIIDSVNGEKVTIDNICQMRELLNTKDGFKNNEIIIRKEQITE